MRRAHLIAVLIAASLAGCRGASVATQNLDVVLSSTDNFRYRGATTNRWKDLMVTGLNSVRSVVSAADRPQSLQTISNPTEFAFDNLLDLSASTQGPVAWRHNEQVRVVARFAVYAPSQLCRELALRQILSHAERLDLSEPFVPPNPPASPAELIEAVDGLTDALRAVSRRRVTETARADFDAALTLSEELDVDVQGGARLLRALGPFLRGRSISGEFKAQVTELSEQVQRRMVAEALWSGARDRSFFVRATGLRVGMEVYGDAYRVEALLALSNSSAGLPWIQEEFSEFQLPPTPINADPVFVAVAQNYEAEGLPLAARRETKQGLELRAALATTLLQIAIRDNLYGARAQHAAMGALSAMSGGELVSLRSEEWLSWGEEALDRLAEQAQALRDD